MTTREALAVRVVEQARAYIAEGCSCRGTHDEARKGCRLNRAFEAMRVAVETYDAGDAAGLFR